MSFGGVRVTTKCPKCGSKDFETHETFEETIVSTVVNCIFPANADDHIVGRVVRIECKCSKCEHFWKPRNAKTLLAILAKE